MELFTRIHFHTLVVFGVVLWTRSAQCATKCTIPSGTSTRTAPNQDAIDFAITDIQSKPEFMSIAIDDYTYTVEACFLVLFIKSAIISQDFLPAGTKVSGVPLSCRSLDENAVQATGTILRYFDDASPKPDAVPDSWYEGNRLVLKIQFFVFPEPSSVTIRCGLTQDHDLLGRIEVFEDVTLTKLGCPKSHWGTECNNSCTCINGGYCDTFDGSCICIGDYDGATCNIHFASTTPAPTYSANTTFSKEESESAYQNYSGEITTVVLHTTSFPKDLDIKALVHAGSGSMSTSLLSISYCFNYVFTLAVLLLFKSLS